MSDTKPQHDSQIHLRIINNHCLGNGIAHGLPLLRSGNLLLRLNANRLFGNSAGLALYGNNLKAVVFQNIRQHAGLFDQSCAMSYTQLFISALPGKLNQLLNPRKLRPQSVSKPIKTWDSCTDARRANSRTVDFSYSAFASENTSGISSMGQNPGSFPRAGEPSLILPPGFSQVFTEQRAHFGVSFPCIR